MFIDIKPENLSLLGSSIFGTQQVEFILKIILSLLEATIKTPHFEKFTLEKIFSQKPEDKKYVNQTLGQFKKIVKKNLIVDDDRFEEYIKKRNDFVHNTFQIYFFYKSEKTEKDFEKEILDFIKENDYFFNHFRGALFLYATELSKQKGKSLNLGEKGNMLLEDYIASNNAKLKKYLAYHRHHKKVKTVLLNLLEELKNEKFDIEKILLYVKELENLK